MPVWLHHAPALLDLTVRAAAALVTATPARLYVCCTRLRLCSPQELQDKLSAACPLPVTVLHEPGADKSVAGAWNWGVRTAFDDGAEYAVLTANDVVCEPACLDTLLAFGRDQANTGVAFWSGVNTRKQQKPPGPAAATDGCDFSCAMLRRETVEAVGWADKHFRPGYWEDTDLYVRSVMAGRSCRKVHAARFDHLGSQTIKLDHEAAHHVRHWFEINRSRFAKKWGTPDSPRNEADCRKRCFTHPWNDPSLPVSFCDRK